MKCTICGFDVNPLDYGSLKLTKRTKLTVLDEKIKNKERILDLTLCDKCRDEIAGELIAKALHEKSEAGNLPPCVSCDGCR